MAWSFLWGRSRFPCPDTGLALSLLTGLAFCMLVAPHVAAQDSPAIPAAAHDEPSAPLPISRLSGPIDLDGRVDEPAWDGVTPLPMVQYLPTFGERPTERSDVRVAYDDDFVYLGARLYDSDAAGILPGAFQRDRLGLANDWIGLSLDTFNDNENMLLFATSPSGIRTDVAFSNDTEGPFPLNSSWNTFWDVATSRTEDGWFAELRIPFSSLRFQDDGGEVVMGMTVWRWIARKQEASLFPAIPPRWRWAHYKPSQARDVTFRGVQRKKPVHVSPYVLLGMQEGKLGVIDGDGTPAFTDFSDPVTEAGLDLKYGVTDNLTFDLTINTDFAQVEADDQRVNFNRFSLFFPEKRLFFQERASAFELNTGGPDRVFHSRRIGLANGVPVRIDGGARLVGRAGDWELGLLNMQTAATELQRSENMGVYRLRRYFLNENTFAGGIVTSRIDSHGRYNVSAGLDALIRVASNDWLTVNWVQTFASDRPTGLSPEDGSLARIQWERRGIEGLLYNVDLSRIGPVYNPGLGFVRRVNVTRIGDRVAYAWRPGESSPVLRHTAAISGSLHLRNNDGSLESAEVGPEWETSTKSGYVFSLGPRLFEEDLLLPFTIAPGVLVPEGRYSFGNVSAEFRTPSGRPRRITVGLGSGSYFDGTRTSFYVRPFLDVSRHLELSLDYELDRIRFDDRAQTLDAHIARFRVRGYLSTALSGSAFLQYNSAVDAFVTNVRIRFNPREGQDLYLVWNEETNTGGFPPVPGGFPGGRTLVVKYRHTLPLEF